MDMQYKTLLTALVLLSSVLTLGISGQSAEDMPDLPTRDLIPHDPIYIDGESDLLHQATFEGWPGVGSHGNPIIISGYAIDANGTAQGIFVNNTDLHLLIRGNLIYEAHDNSPRPQGDGIKLMDVSNCTVSDNTLRECYYNGVYLDKCHDVVVRGNRIIDTNYLSGLFILDSKGCRLIGNNITGPNNEGANIKGSTDILLEMNDIVGMEADGLRIHTSEDIISKGNNISDCGDYAINIIAPRGINYFYSNRLVGCTITSQGDYGYIVMPENNTLDGKPIYFYKYQDMAGMAVPNDAGMVMGLQTTGLKLSDLKLPGYDGVIRMMECDDIIMNNVTLTEGKSPIILDECSSVNITGCHFKNNSVISIIVYSSNDVEVGHCHFSDHMNNEDDYGIVYSGGSGLIFHNNTVLDKLRPLTCSMNNRVQIKDNRIHGMMGDAIQISSVSVFEISGNEFIQQEGVTGGMGMRLSGSEKGRIDNNSIRYFQTGLSCEYVSESELTGNVIDRCGGVGIDVDHASDLTIQGNLIHRSKDFGIRIEVSEGCLVTHNSLILNNNSTATYNALKAQASDDGPENRWNGSREGNYWSDWTSPDSDGDGIVDAPYPVKGGDNYDNYPLTKSPVLLVSEPGNVKAKAGNGFVNISWAEPEMNLADEILGYRIERRANTSSAPTVMETESLYYLDEGVENGVTYNYTVLALNIYGEGAESEPVSATPDGSSPVVEIIRPVNGSYLNTTAVKLEWNSTDNTDITNNSYRVDSGNWTDTGSVLSAMLNLTEGEHTAEVVAYDPAGNSGGAQTTFTVDITPPQIELDPVGNGYINSDTVTINWDASDAMGGISHFQVVLDSDLIDESVDDTSYILESLSEGDHTVIVTAVDLAGNWNTDALDFNVDLTSPVVVIESPSEGCQVEDSYIDIEWMAIETGSSISSYELKLDDEDWIDIPSTETTDVTWRIEELSVGEHQVTIRATDMAGNTGEDSVGFTVHEGEIPAQTNRITGTVLDEGGDPVKGVKVTSDTGEETQTDSEGYFSLEVEAGNRLLTFEKEGYQTWKKWVDASGNETVNMDDVTLEEKEEERSRWYVWCGSCCLIVIALIVILMVIGWMSKRRKGPRERLDVLEE